LAALGCSARQRFSGGEALTIWQSIIDVQSDHEFSSVPLCLCERPDYRIAGFLGVSHRGTKARRFLAWVLWGARLDNDFRAVKHSPYGNRLLTCNPFLNLTPCLSAFARDRFTGLQNFSELLTEAPRHGGFLAGVLWGARLGSTTIFG
jgi:hypothetical protein